MRDRESASEFEMASKHSLPLPLLPRAVSSLKNLLARRGDEFANRNGQRKKGLELIVKEADATCRPFFATGKIFNQDTG